MYVFICIFAIIWESYFIMETTINSDYNYKHAYEY